MDDEKRILKLEEKIEKQSDNLNEFSEAEIELIKLDMKNNGK